MATKKITLNELRALVKQIVKENFEDESTLSYDEKAQIRYNTLLNTGGLFSKEGINDFIKELPKPIPSHINYDDFSLEEWLEGDVGKFWGRVKNEKIYDKFINKWLALNNEARKYFFEELKKYQ